MGEREDQASRGAETRSAFPTGRPLRKRRRWLRRFVQLIVALLLLILLAGVAGGAAAYLAYDYVTRPGIAGAPVRIEVPEGASGRDAARILVDAGLLDAEWPMRLALRLVEHEDRLPLRIETPPENRTIKHGTYLVPQGLSPLELLERLYHGPNAPFDPDALDNELRVTVPEGLSLAQMAALFDDPAAFLDAAADPELTARLGLGTNSLEGFLMPDTYFFSEKPTEREVVERMLAHFETEIAELLAVHPKPEGMTLLDVVTVASLVEEESRVDEERPLVASVIYNRLRRGMALDLDSTLQYALGKYGQRMLDEDKRTPSPYNTYRNRGLPPGPISSPGRTSLEAALAPAETDYLFFVSNADGRTHTFSATLAEHNRAVARYRREIAEQRRRLREQQE